VYGNSNDALIFNLNNNDYLSPGSTLTLTQSSKPKSAFINPLNPEPLFLTASITDYLGNAVNSEASFTIQATSSESFYSYGYADIILNPYLK